MPSHQPISRATAYVGLLLTVSLGGCQGRPDDYVLATGEFVFEDGTPLNGVNGLVQFTPINERNRRALLPTPAIGDLQSDGTFELSTYEKQHGQQHKGLRVGEYNVVLMEYAQQDKPRVVQEKYQQFEDSTLRATVAADGNNHFKLVLERIEQQGPQ